ncbi:MAG: hypothetical protein WC488_01685 [Candidatus Micrarchaeia archaeon]
MLVSTDRHPSRESRAFARAFASSIGSFYRARGKKTVDALVSEARKKGENILSIVSSSEISFISISVSSWGWKQKTLRVIKYSFEPDLLKKPCEIGAFEGKEGKELESLFGFDAFYGGDAVLFAEGGKMRIIRKEKNLLEMEYGIQECRVEK